MLYLYFQNIVISTCKKYRKYWDILHSFVHHKSDAPCASDTAPDFELTTLWVPHSPRGHGLEISEHIHGKFSCLILIHYPGKWPDKEARPGRAQPVVLRLQSHRVPGGQVNSQTTGPCPLHLPSSKSGRAPGCGFLTGEADAASLGSHFEKHCSKGPTHAHTPVSRWLRIEILAFHLTSHSLYMHSHEARLLRQSENNYQRTEVLLIVTPMCCSPCPPASDSRVTSFGYFVSIGPVWPIPVLCLSLADFSFISCDCGFNFFKGNHLMKS